MTPSRLLVLGAAVLAALAPARAQKAPAAPINYPPQPTGNVPVFPKDQIKPGMVGYSFTVMQGSRIVPIRTRILGVAADGLGPGLDLIIGVLDDPKTDLTGAVHGMSGSPLYIADPATGEWKMAGALSRRIAMFEKDGHCGFTPLEDMLAVGAKLKEAPKPGALPQRLGAAPLIPSPAVAASDTPSASPLLSMLGMPVGAGQQPRAESLAIPLTVTGVTEAAWRQIAHAFRLGEGFLPVQGGGGSPSASQLGPDDLQPGSPVAAVLMTGGVSMAGTGTLTWRQGNRILAFGHAMMGFGHEAYGMGTAEIITVVPSYLRPFKMANQGNVVGTVTQDRYSAIGGFVGPTPFMAPYRIQRTHDGQARRDISGTWVPHDALTPELLTTAMISSLELSDDTARIRSITLKGELKLEGHPPLNLDGYYGQSGAGMFESAMLMMNLAGPLVTLYNQNLERLTATDFSLTMETSEKYREWSIESMNTDRQRYEPGETVRVNVELLETFGGRTWKSFELPLPENLKSGDLTLRAASAQALNAMDQWQRIMSCRTIDELIAALNARRRDNRLYVQIVTPAEGEVVADREMPALPGTVRDVMRGGNRSTKPPELNENVWLEKDEVFPGTVNGIQEIRIELK